jgi:1-acyl-sn-glycerol-3-phosphate acyltransferase
MILLRSSLFNLWFYGVTVGYALLGAGLRLLGRHAPVRWPERLVRHWSGMVLAGLGPIAGISYQVSGRENLPAGPAVIASMHQSAFDTVVWLLLLPNPAYVLKRELTRIPVFGPMCALAGMIAVDRGAGAAAIRSLLRGGARAVAEGRSIVIFPEGTRVAPGRRARLQPGVAALATRIKVPVVPVVTDSGRHWGRRAFRKRPGVIHIMIRPPLAPGLTRDEVMAGLAAEFEHGAAALGTPWEDVDNSVGTAPPRFPS